MTTTMTSAKCSKANSRSNIQQVIQVEGEETEAMEKEREEQAKDLVTMGSMRTDLISPRGAGVSRRRRVGCSLMGGMRLLLEIDEWMDLGGEV